MTAFVFEASGRVTLPSQEELVAADETSAIIALSQGKLSDGSPYYAYIAIKPSLYREFCARTKAGDALTLSDYGTIITIGYDAEPPAEVVAEMREKYGFENDYETKLINEAKGQQGEFLKKKEDKRIGDIVAMLKKKQSHQ
jgi:hypothetical protein